MAHPESCTATKAAIVHPIEPTPATWNRRIRRINSLRLGTWSTLKSRPTSVPTMAKQARMAHRDVPATVHRRRWMGASFCAVEGDTRLEWSRSQKDATVLSTGVVM